MGGSDIKPNEFTLSMSLKASGILGIPENGMQIHEVCAKSNFEWVPVVGNSLIDMYNKCRIREANPCCLDQTRISLLGSISALVDLYVKCRHIAEARTVFNRTEQKNVTSWSTLILGYTQENNLPEAMNLFHTVKKEQT
ncbi:Tetratricopeptide-like helical domain superfamily [Sesbania bispinosa]|nr:Tetratricopeptide-like helical domain superfamily [Sesbania bispinosa]